MQLPFSAGQFLDVFRAYNDAIGIAPAILIALAIALIALAHSQVAWRHRAITSGLALLWLWAGAVYHWGFFARINPAAQLFGALFVLQAAILLASAFRDRLHFNPRTAGTSWLGWVLMAYALLVYPVLGIAAGHGYPDGPSFGAPCPTTIFFLGMVFWVREPLPVKVVAIPLAWAFLGTSAAVQLGIPEDFALGVAAILVAAEVSRRRFLSRRALRQNTG